MTIDFRLLHTGDESLLADAASDVFDNDVQPELAAELLSDPRHYLAVAIDDGRIVGFASAVHYFHPDKSPELWVNEVGVSSAYQRRGLATQLLQTLFDAGLAAGCTQAWVLTHRTNRAAMALYGAVGGVEAPGDTVMFEFPLGAHEPRPGERHNND